MKSRGWGTLFIGLLVLGVMLTTALSTLAVEVTAEKAKVAVFNWVTRHPAPLGSKIGRKVVDATTYFGATGSPLFHVVKLSEGGFVVTSADDGVTPIIAFSENENLIVDSRNPFWVLLNRDLEQRNRAVKLHQAQPQFQGLGVQPKSSLTDEWGALLADKQNGELGLSSVSDVRVGPIVQSKWSQSTVNGNNTYNYYTPNNYVCGCVATAGAQIMRYHQYPSSAVATGTYTCFVNGSGTALTMFGGVYAWANMPLVPSASVTLTQRQAIGRLTYDVGVASYMKYASGGSGALDSNLAFAFVNRFGYASACIVINQESGVDGYLQQAVLSDLDAGFPVVFGIQGDAGGHEVVGDGYGYTSGTLYVHLNMGWAGSDDAWYNLPAIDSDPAFAVLGSIVFNIFPSHSGEVISGRVLDSMGVPVTGATVVATDETTGVTLAAVTSNDKGIYAVLVPKPTSPSTHLYRLTASSGSQTGTQSTTVSASTSTETTYNENTGAGGYYPGTGSVGNRWGVNLTLTSSLALTSIVISGASAVNSGNTAPYTCTATFSDGSTKAVAPSWSISSGSYFALITSSGLLTANGTAASPESVTVSASFTTNGVTRTATQAVTVQDPIGLASAVDYMIGTWTLSGNAYWFGQTATTYDGVDAARSGFITDSQTSWFEKTVVGPGTISFKWCVSSEANFDKLLFKYDGSTAAGLSGIGGAWTNFSKAVASGSHQLRWSYEKDSSWSAGSDCGWVDQVVWATNSTINLSVPVVSTGGVATSSSLTNNGSSWTFVCTNRPAWVTSASVSVGGGNVVTLGSGTYSVGWTGVGSVSISATTNTTGSSRSWVLQVTATDGVTYQITFAQAALTAPPAPTSVSASDGASTLRVVVSWAAAAGAAGYEVYRNTSDVSSAASKLVGLAGTSYTNTVATPGLLYYFWVKATNSFGASAFSVSDSGYRTLSAPAGVNATDTGTNDVTVVWNASTGASHYRVYRATSAAGAKTALGSWVTARSFSDTSAEAGITYYYWVVAAVDAAGSRPSAYSSSNTGIRRIPVIVTFDVQGGETLCPVEQTLLVGLSYGPLPVPLRAGYRFAGWWTGLEGTGAEVRSDTLVASSTNHTLCARWVSDSEPIVTQVAKLTGNTDARFGGAVAIAGDSVIIGAFNEDLCKGAAYIYIREATNWVLQTRLVASDGVIDNYFGASVAISGDTVVVGAYGADSYTGAAYVFVRQGTNWVQQARLSASDGSTGDCLGFSVAISGDRLVAGALEDDSSKGSAYVYVRQGTSWSEEAKLTASDGLAWDNFGAAVTISGDTVAVGASSADSYCGAAYVFARQGSAWPQQARIDAGIGQFGSYFGASLSVYADTLIVGASGMGGGAAYVFVRQDSSWLYQATLSASDGAADDLFGYSVSISGDVVLVGAVYDDEKGEDSGAAYQYIRQGTTWRQQTKVTAGGNWDTFGTSVAVSGDTFVVGAEGAEGGGAAYIFTAQSPLPEIVVEGNGEIVADGDTTPSGADHTDFGRVAISGGAFSRTFTICNTGTTTLHLNGNPVVSVTGSQAAEFTVTAQPAGTVCAGGSTTFTVQFAPRTVGLRTATLSIENDDADEAPYDFAIQGFGVEQEAADYEYSIMNGVATVTRYIGAGGNVTVPVTLEGYPVKVIGSLAFWQCESLVSVAIPNSVTNIGIGAFEECTGLTSAVIGAGVTSLGEGTFFDCSSLESVTIPDSVTNIGEVAFYRCSGLSSVTIPDSVVSIGYSAFAGCSGLVSVKIPDNVTSIASDVFGGCTGLTNVVIGVGVTGIGDYAFCGCSGLSSVTIPDRVTSIGMSGFYGCNGLTSVFFKGNEPQPGIGMFDGVSAAILYVYGTSGWSASYGGLTTAVWTARVTFNAGAGTPSYASRTYNVGNAYGTLPTATRSGYTFGGWNTATNGTGTAVTSNSVVPYATTDFTLYATWTMGQVVTPSISPTNGTVFTTASKRVTITCATDGADIRFTTNGANPTAASGLYSGSFNVNATTTVKARGFKAGMADSEVAVAVITKPVVITLAEAMEVPSWTVTTGGDASWTPQAVVTHDGIDAVRTGIIGASQTTWLETSVSGAGALTFWWRASCEDSPDEDWDFMTFAVDGIEKARADGDSDWQQVSVILPAGSHTLRWAYSKDDADEIVYEDCGWVDQVVWSAAGGSTTTTEVPVPYTWLDQFGLVVGGNYEAAALADSDGDGFLTWQEYLAGTVPTNRESVFSASIMLSNGVPFVTWTPDLGTERVYTVEGKSSLTNAAWLSPANASSRFFRVKLVPRN